MRLPRIVQSVWDKLSPGQQRFVRFGFVGATGAIVNFAFMALGMWLFSGFTEEPRELAASILGVAVSVVTNFILNDAGTWGDRAKDAGRRATAKRFSAYAVGAALGLGLQVGIAATIRLTLDWNPYIAQAIGIGFGTIVNYVINNRVVFKDKHESPPTSGSEERGREPRGVIEP
jgi:dolichol-phosphate mannosyltransferase